MPDIGEEPRWLDADQQRSWRALVLGTTLLFDRLDDDLRRRHNVSLAEYEILVRLSERDGRMRMAQLADAMAHSRSRITHTIKRMERSELVERCESPEDGRGVIARLTDAAHCCCATSPPLMSRVCVSTWSTSPPTRTSRPWAGCWTPCATT